MEKSSKINLHCIILAAGQGTRMKSSISKVLHKISGKPMVEILLDLARNMHAEITVVTSQGNNQDISNLLHDGENTVIQEERLGTAHAVLTAQKQMEESSADKVLILYGDTPLVTNKTLQNIITQKNNVSFLAFKEENTENKYGRLVTNGNKLLEIVEYKDATAHQRDITLCNSGVVCVERSFLLKALQMLKPSQITGEYYLTDIAKLASVHQETCGFILCEQSEVLGVNSRKELAEIDAIMQERIKIQHMQNGVTFILPHTTYIHIEVEIAQDVIIEPNCYIGANTKIDEGVVIHAMSHLENCIVHSGVEIGPFARIRPQTELHSGVKIGNFVEVKNSQIGKNSKANHLSYIGDTTIKENCNIGAGTVFCNYNGFQKFRSTIEDGTFIGSNSTIISPVKIGKGSIVGAGSVITESTQENSLTIAREKQVEIINGGEKFRSKHSNK